MVSHRIATIAALFTSASCLPSFLDSKSLATTDLHPRAVCRGNTATTRSEWCDHSVDTDYMTQVPDTGVTREYWLDLTEVTVAPDGVPRTAMAVNGSIPGPTLHADWGDIVKIHVTNSLDASKNGTSIHWHGIRQNHTNDQDGVRAEQYGSSWYHSHFALQTYQGIFGGLVINGPATSNYDEDLGMLFLSDWSRETVDELWDTVQRNGPPTMANALINGTNTSGNGGHRFNTTLTPNKSYRIRVINTAIDTHFKFTIDNHNLTVIGADLVPITPFTTTVLNIGIAQRYDIIIHADQAATASSFWLRAIPQAACSDVDNADDVRGIVYYSSSGTASNSQPTTKAFDYVDSCADETRRVVPHVAKTVGADTSTMLEPVTAAIQNSVFKWYLNSTSMLVDWADPTLLQVLSGNTSFATADAVVALPRSNEWVYVAIQTELPIPHPIHLHGHDFFVLAQGTGAYVEGVTPLKLENPPRRDTAMLPAAGHLVLAFETDNPGAWLMHCHIGWHTSQGFALQFLERVSEIPAITDSSLVKNTCSSWVAHDEKHNIEQGDSGV